MVLALGCLLPVLIAARAQQSYCGPQPGSGIPCLLAYRVVIRCRAVQYLFTRALMGSFKEREAVMVASNDCMKHFSGQGAWDCFPFPGIELLHIII